MFPLFQSYLLRQSLISGTLQSRMVALFILPVGFGFSCVRLQGLQEDGGRFFLNIILLFWKMHLGFPSERSFKNPQQWSKTKTGDIANHPLAKPTTVPEMCSISQQKCNWFFFSTFLLGSVITSQMVSFPVWQPAPLEKMLCSLFGFLNIKMRKIHNSERNVRVYMAEVVEAPVPLQTIKLALVAPVDLGQGSLTQSFNARDPAFCPRR